MSPEKQSLGFVGATVSAWLAVMIIDEYAFVTDVGVRLDAPRYFDVLALVPAAFLFASTGCLLRSFVLATTYPRLRSLSALIHLAIAAVIALVLYVGPKL
jgi:hypothetical protein